MLSAAGRLSARLTQVRCLHFGTKLSVPALRNEPIFDYSPNTACRRDLLKEIERQKATPIDVPIIIHGQEYRTGNTVPITSPQNHSVKLGQFHLADEALAHKAIESSLSAWREWNSLPVEHRLAVFLKLADLISGPYRAVLNAATMLGQGKTFFQAEIDSACESIDFLRFNVHYAQQIYADQPSSGAGMWNRVEYRPLEGFVYAVSPFNFTAIAMNLSTAPATMGNTVVWKPSHSAVLSGYWLARLYKEAGLPDGVINFVPANPELMTKVALNSEHLAGVHFTGSTEVFRKLWVGVGERLGHLRNFPRLVGETGGKDYIFAHVSAKRDALIAALIRGAFEYSGQKCSACSVAYIPESLWKEISAELIQQTQQLKVGEPTEATTFVGPVINKDAFTRISGWIERTKKTNGAKIVAGGTYDDSKGWFIQPTIIETRDPSFPLLRTEIFGPVLTVFVYADTKVAETLQFVENNPYALTGAIFAQDRLVIDQIMKQLPYSAGNFYINDKPTGAVVGQQPFGGNRASGTNDKAGSYLNLLRWVSPKTIKETFVPPTNYRYDYMRDN